MANLTKISTAVGAWAHRAWVIDTIKRAIKSNGLDSVADAFGEPPIIPHAYQANMVKMLLQRISYTDDAVREDGKGDMLYAPTGAGKTEMALMSMIYLRKFAPGLSIGFITNRDELVGQTCRRAYGCGINAWRFQSGYEVNPDKQRAHCDVGSIEEAGVIVSSSQTFLNRASADKAPLTDITFFDEAHGDFYKGYWHKVIQQGLAVGLSATPYEPVMRKKWNKGVIVGISQKELELTPFRMLATPRFMAPRLSEEERVVVEVEKENIGVREVEKKFNRQAAEALHEQVKRRIVKDILETEEKIRSDLFGTDRTHCARYSERRWLVRAPNQAFAAGICEVLNDGGITAKMFTSDSDADKKRQLAEINAIFDGKSEARAAVIVQKFVVGYDHPGIEGVVITNNCDRNVFFQYVGRSIRSGGGLKHTAFVLDLAGNIEEYGEDYFTIWGDPPKEILDPREFRRLKKEQKQRKDTGNIDIRKDGDLVIFEGPEDAVAIKRKEDAEAKRIEEEERLERERKAEIARIEKAEKDVKAARERAEKQRQKDIADAAKRAEDARKKAERDEADRIERVKNELPLISQQSRNVMVKAFEDEVELPIDLAAAVCVRFVAMKASARFGQPPDIRCKTILKWSQICLHKVSATGCWDAKDIGSATDEERLFIAQRLFQEGTMSAAWLLGNENLHQIPLDKKVICDLMTSWLEDNACIPVSTWVPTTTTR